MRVCEDLCVYSAVGLQRCLQALEGVSVRDVVLEPGSVQAFGANNNDTTAEFFR